MVSGFAPEFLILLGIDIFLGASILTVLLDKHFPAPLPYVMDAAALIGFGELASGPSFISAFSIELQFYYSFTFAAISVLALFATNLYLLFLRKRVFESAIVAVFATIPSALGILYFTSAFVNGLTISLPIVPAVPIEGVYALFGVSILLVVVSLIFVGKKGRMGRTEQLGGPKEASRPSETIQSPAPMPQATTNVPAVSDQRSNNGSPSVHISTPPPSPEPQVSSGANASEWLRAEGPPVEAGGSGAAARAGSVINDETIEPAAAGPAEDRANSSQPLPPGSPQFLQGSGADYSKRLRESIKFFEKALKKPVVIDPASLRGTFRDAKKAYLTPAAMVLVVDSSGTTSSRSLLELSTDEALQVMSEAMKALGKGA